MTTPLDAEARLFMGVINSMQQEPGKTDIATDRYIGWKHSQDEARGEWVKSAMDARPGYSILGVFIDDITDIAEQRPAVRAILSEQGS
jgi:hypothetical protein